MQRQRNRIGVFGDVILDIWRKGETTLASPGGAANVAAHLSALGFDVTLHGGVGDDDVANELTEVCKQHQVKTHFWQFIGNTSVRWHSISGKQSLNVQPPEDWKSVSFTICNDFDLVVIVDHGLGFITGNTSIGLSDFPLIVDTRCPNRGWYDRASIVKTSRKHGVSEEGFYRITTNDAKPIQISSRDGDPDHNRALLVYESRNPSANTIGAGDAFTAGLAYGFLAEFETIDSLLFARDFAKGSISKKSSNPTSYITLDDVMSLIYNRRTPLSSV